MYEDGNILAGQLKKRVINGHPVSGIRAEVIPDTLLADVIKEIYGG